MQNKITVNGTTYVREDLCTKKVSMEPSDWRFHVHSDGMNVYYKNNWVVAFTPEGTLKRASRASREVPFKLVNGCGDLSEYGRIKIEERE